MDKTDATIFLPNGELITILDVDKVNVTPVTIEFKKDNELTVIPISMKFLLRVKKSAIVPAAKLN